jgi:hypothetical protein
MPIRPENKGRYPDNWEAISVDVGETGLGLYSGAAVTEGTEMRTTFRVPKPKAVHRGKFVDEDGNVSALCYARPRAIDLSKATWTNRDEAVTCKRCLALMDALREATAKQGGVSA